MLSCHGAVYAKENRPSALACKFVLLTGEEANSRQNSKKDCHIHGTLRLSIAK